MRLKLFVSSWAVVLLSSCSSVDSMPESARPPERAGRTARDAFASATFEAGPQAWTMLCDNRELSVGLRNEGDTLTIRSILWNDGERAPGTDRFTGRPMSDLSVLLVHVGDDSARTAGKDVDVSLNPWPHMPGIYVSRYTRPNATTPLQKLEGASGSIDYRKDSEGRLIRTDRYEVPVSDLAVESGSRISVTFFALSMVPEFSASCAPGYERGTFFPTAIPVTAFRPINLKGG